jgi:hypothetical protein
VAPNRSAARTRELDNFWATADLQSFLEQREGDVQSWPEMLSRVRARYTNLTFLDNMERHLAGEPFSSTIAQRVLILLDILNRVKAGFTATGERSDEGEQLIVNYFRHSKAAFTDASETEKNDAIYRAAMTFRLPNGDPLECFWHGKISHRYFRIHFSPITPDQPLYIAYIGPKLTKQ